MREVLFRHPYSQWGHGALGEGRGVVEGKEERKMFEAPEEAGCALCLG